MLNLIPSTKQEAKKRFAEAVERLKTSHQRHSEILLYGSSDRFSPHDGTGLFLTRNQIISNKNELKNIHSIYDFPLPREYDLETPKIYPMDYNVPNRVNKIA